MVQFGKRMLEAQVPEWSDQYADYKGLKKMLKRMMAAQPALIDANNSSAYERHQKFSSSDAPISAATISVTVRREGEKSTEEAGDQLLAEDDTVHLLQTSISGGSDVRLQQLFFEKMDDELKKVETFYVTQRQEMVSTLEQIERQFDCSLEAQFDNVAGISSGELKIDMAVVNNETKETTAPKFKAKRQIKYALMELYKGLAMLHNFSVYNNTAFEKILKKYDKNMALKAREIYLAKQQGCAFALQEGWLTPKSLQERCQHLYARVFTNGSRKEACAELDGSIGMLAMHPDGANISVAGFCFGCSVTLIPVISLMLVAEDKNGGKIATHPEFEAMWPVFRVVLWVLLHVTGIGLCMEVWERHKVNYRFIFSFNPSTGPNIRPAFVIATAAIGWAIALSLLLLQMILLLDPCPSLFAKPDVSLPTLPSILFFSAMLTVANPLPLLHRDARARVARVVRKIITVPISLRTTVQFEDFFVG
jgi:hypothetical protein